MAAPIPAIPARWLYDKRGSQLFDEITRIPSYYPTRTETALLREIVADVATYLPQRAAVVEFGAGSATKTPVLLQAINPKTYVPVDISGQYLEESAEELRERFPELDVLPVVSDFTQDFVLPEQVQATPKIGFFPGSTIGNFVPSSATNLLRSFRKLLGNGSMLLIGLDRIKPVDRLIAAYDDPEGVTAAFNLNLLHRINREMDGNVPTEAFRHEARWNDAHRRIEMHLVATRDVRFNIDGVAYALSAGASIHTENSHKYDDGGARVLLQTGGWTSVAQWKDTAGDFLVILARAEAERFAP